MHCVLSRTTDTLSSTCAHEPPYTVILQSKLRSEMHVQPVGAPGLEARSTNTPISSPEPKGAPYSLNVSCPPGMQGGGSVLSCACYRTIRLTEDALKQCC